jgi:hypothetical protein
VARRKKKKVKKAKRKTVKKRARKKTAKQVASYRAERAAEEKRVASLTPEEKRELTRKATEKRIIDLEEHGDFRIGSRVGFQSGIWTISRIKAGTHYEDQKDTPTTVFHLEHESGPTIAKTSASLASPAECSLLDNPLDAIVAATADTPETDPFKMVTSHKELLGISHDPRTVITHGRLFIRPTSDVWADSNDGGTAIKRHIIAGCVLGDLRTRPESDKEYAEDELWLCDVIALRPIKRFRGYSRKGEGIDQILCGAGLDPSFFEEEVR